jgi:hypothetical protein
MPAVIGAASSASSCRTLAGSNPNDSTTGGVSLVAAVTAASGRVAGDLIKDAAKAVGGGGGGKGDIATAGGKNPEGLDEALRIHPRHGLALGLTGDVAARMGDLRLADERWRMAAVLRHDIGPELARARIARLQGRPDDAEAFWAAAEAQVRAEVAGGKADHRRDLAVLLLDRGRPAELAEARALLAAERTIREDAETLDQVARASLLAGDIAAADDALSKLRAIGGHDAGWLAHAADAARARHDEAAAQAAEAEADALDPTWRKDLTSQFALETEPR